MVIRNYLSFIKKHKIIFLILMISQIFSLISIYFVFGIFQNNLYELSANLDTKSLAASLEGCDIQPSQLKEIIVEVVDEYNYDIDYMYVGGTSKDGKWNYLDRAQYKEGKLGYSDSVRENVKNDTEGTFATSEQYQKAEKVVVINPEDKKKIGEEITFNGEGYKVIGINGVSDKGEVEIPFTAFPKDCQWSKLSFGMKMLPTRAEYEQFSEMMREIGAKPEEFYIQNNADLKREYSMIVVSILLALLAGGNMYIIFRYIFRRRRKELAIYMICGCNKTRARRMFFGEIIINMLIVIAIGILSFRFLVYPLMLNWFSYLSVIYGIKQYLIIAVIFLGITLGIGYFLSRSMSKQKIIEIRKGEL